MQQNNIQIPETWDELMAISRASADKDVLLGNRYRKRCGERLGRN